MKSQLLCTFSNQTDIDTDIEDILKTYTIIYNSVFILQNRLVENDLYITYNIDTGINPNIELDNTILIHRKKETNTIYTINALNHLIREENGGYLDTSYIINWEKYQNSILLTTATGAKIIETKLLDIIKLNEN